MFRQQEPRRQAVVHKDSNLMEHLYDNRMSMASLLALTNIEQCDDYFCADTLECVKKPMDCPCPFSASQLKCVMPDKKSYVCISKPTGSEDEDHPRDCSFVEKAWKGEV